MKASEADLRHVVELFRGSFDSPWIDPEFERINPFNEEQRARLEQALQTARGDSSAPATHRSSSTCGLTRSRTAPGRRST